MRLMSLFRLINWVLALVVAAMLWRLAGTDLAQWRQAEQGVQALQDLQRGLGLMEMISRERAPSFAVLGDIAPSDTAPQLTLTRARQRTDLAFQSLQPTPPEVQRARQVVEAVRESVDAMAMRGRIGDDAAKQGNDVGRLRDAVLLITPLVDQRAAAAGTAFPALASDVSAAMLAADLREEAGVLGTWLRPALLQQRRLTEYELTQVLQLRGRIEARKILLDRHLGAHTMGPAVKEVRERLALGYFGRTQLELQRLIDAGMRGTPYATDVTQFGDIYVPDMAPLLGLRDAVLAQALNHARDTLQQAQTSLQLVLVATVLAALLLVGSMALVHHRVMRPLAATAVTIQALADGEPVAAWPVVERDDEIGAVLGAVRALQASEVARRALEQERAELIEQLSELSSTDSLTGLLNRRAFFAAGERELVNAHRHTIDTAALVIDIDHFKQINDSYGHAVGDQALVAVAGALQGQMRHGDLVSRHGGEEFVVLLTHCDLTQARGIAERLRQTVAGLNIATPLGSAFGVTISVGVAALDLQLVALDDLVARADQAMYRAKRNGRNQVVLAEDLHDSSPGPDEHERRLALVAG